MRESTFNNSSEDYIVGKEVKQTLCLGIVFLCSHVFFTGLFLFGVPMAELIFYGLTSALVVYVVGRMYFQIGGPVVVMAVVSVAPFWFLKFLQQSFSLLPQDITTKADMLLGSATTSPVALCIGIALAYSLFVTAQIYYVERMGHVAQWLFLSMATPLSIISFYQAYGDTIQMFVVSSFVFIMMVTVLHSMVKKMLITPDSAVMPIPTI